MFLTPASFRTELRARRIRNDIQKAKNRGDNPKEECWFQKTMMKLLHLLSNKIPFMHTVNEKRREKRAARAPYQSVPLPADFECVYAAMTQGTLELDPYTDNGNGNGNEVGYKGESSASDTSSVREDMFHLDGLDMLGNERGIRDTERCQQGLTMMFGWLGLCRLPQLFTLMQNQSE